MLNWIAYYVGLYLFGQGGPLQNTEQVLQPDIERRCREREAAGLLGGPRPARPPHRALHRTGVTRRVLDPHQPDDARLRGARSGLQPRGGPLRRHLAWRATTSSPWRSRACSPASRAPWTCSAGATRSASRTSSPLRSGSSASPWRSSAATPRSASACLRSSSRHCSTAPRRETSRPRSFDIPEQAGNLSLTIQALVLLFIGADIVILGSGTRAARRSSTVGRGIAGVSVNVRAPSRRGRLADLLRPSLPRLDRHRAGQSSRSGSRCLL